MTKDILQSTLATDSTSQPGVAGQSPDPPGSTDQTPGSLGRLEELAAWYVAVREEFLPTIRKKVVVLSPATTASSPKASVRILRRQPSGWWPICQGGAGINVLSRSVGAEVQVVDIGVSMTLPACRG